MKQQGSFDTVVGFFRQVLESLPDKRTGKNSRYGMEDAALHSVVTPVIVSPHQSQVIPLVPEFIVPQDGNDKQDCENSAAKRWLLQHGSKYSALNMTVLGDDLYSRQPLCQMLLEQNFNFILVCRPESHPTLYEHIEGVDLPTVVVNKWTGKFQETNTYRYLK